MYGEKPFPEHEIDYQQRCGRLQRELDEARKAVEGVDEFREWLMEYPTCIEDEMFNLALSTATVHELFVAIKGGHEKLQRELNETHAALRQTLSEMDHQRERAEKAEAAIRANDENDIEEAQAKEIATLTEERDAAQGIVSNLNRERLDLLNLFIAERDTLQRDNAKLRAALDALKEDYADSEGCYCGQLVRGCDSEGVPLGICGYCQACAALTPPAQEPKP